MPFQIACLVTIDGLVDSRFLHLQNFVDSRLGRVVDLVISDLNRLSLICTNAVHPVDCLLIQAGNEQLIQEDSVASFGHIQANAAYLEHTDKDSGWSFCPLLHDSGTINWLVVPGHGEYRQAPRLKACSISRIHVTELGEHNYMLTAQHQFLIFYLSQIELGRDILAVEWKRRPHDLLQPEQLRHTVLNVQRRTVRLSELHFGNDFVVKLLLFRQHLHILCDDLNLGQVEHVILTSPQHVVAKMSIENLLVLDSDYFVAGEPAQRAESIYESPVALEVRFGRIHPIKKRP